MPCVLYNWNIHIWMCRVVLHVCICTCTCAASHFVHCVSMQKCRYQNLVKMTVVSCPTVVDITIVRPDLKFQLGFAIQDGVVR